MEDRCGCNRCSTVYTGIRQPRQVRQDEALRAIVDQMFQPNPFLGRLRQLAAEVVPLEGDGVRGAAERPAGNIPNLTIIDCQCGECRGRRNS